MFDDRLLVLGRMLRLTGRCLLMLIALIMITPSQSFRLQNAAAAAATGLAMSRRCRSITMLAVSSKPSRLAGANNLKRMVDRKKIEVDAMLRQHDKEDDPLMIRMSYLATENHFNITRSLKRDQYGPEHLHTVSVIVDMKRRSPTIADHQLIVDFEAAPKYAELLVSSGADALFVNTNEFEYGGSESDLASTSRLVRGLRNHHQQHHPPACIHKDVIIHPIQIAKALQDGASGVLLILSIVGKDLGELLDACTIMGAEAIVEVHSPKEVDYALGCGATILLVNMWDRNSGKLFPDQAKGVAHMMPMNVISIAAGNIRDMSQISELGFYGYESVVLGRGITEVGDLRTFFKSIHEYKGLPRSMRINMGMKGLPWG